MRAYKVHLHKIDGSPLVFESAQPNDQTVIRMADKLSSGRGFEVWHEQTCICRKSKEKAEEQAA